MAVVAVAAILADPDYGLFDKSATNIIELEGIIDAYLTESHSERYTKSEYPTETRESRTDNLTRLPARLVLEGFVSNITTIGGTVQIPGQGRPVDSWQRIREIARKEQTVSALTALGFYENMLITGFDVTINRDTGTAMNVSIVLEEAEFARTQTARFPENQLSGGAAGKSSTVNGGTKQSPTTPDSQASVLRRGINALLGG